jgi:RNA polymerase sigma factor (TIGR02999 family)
MPSSRDITQVLHSASHGDEAAAEQLFPLVYEELRRLARGYLNGERPGHTLQATAVVHEAFMRLVGTESVAWQDRAHFFAMAARAMRRVLIDHARSRGRQKRGGGWERIPLDRVASFSVGAPGTELLALHEALERLDAEHPDIARIVELKFFGGLTSKEIGEVIGRSDATVERHWKFGRAWLYRAMVEPEDGTEGHA